MVFSIFGRKPRPDDLLPAGWQFFSRPTNLEPPGTVFRIDAEGRRFIVTRLAPVVSRGSEPGAARAERIEARAGVVARLLGLQSWGAHVGGGRTRTFRFEISSPVRESTTDDDLDRVLTPYLREHALERDSRYFVIRETRSATAMTFLLQSEEAGEMGGSAAVLAAGDGSVTLTARSAEVSELTQAFPERLGVMFLAEEIAPVKAGLAGEESTWGRVPVAAAIDWVEPDYATVRVFFATDRSLKDGAAPSEMFGGERSDLRYGGCDVSIPRDHRMGELESRSILRLEFREDPARHVVLLGVETWARDRFLDELGHRAAASGTQAAFLFIHGYNVSFELAARRTAQIAYDLGFEGAPIFYSWPSRASVAAYTVDEATIEWAQANLRSVLEDLLMSPEVRSLYLIAHSMGNRALTRAVGALLAEKPALRAQLREVILTAPDIDAEVFTRDLVPALTAGGLPVTLYASSEDLALLASKKVHGYPRAGDAGPGLLVVEGVETVDATAVDTSLVGHSYFAENRSVLSDIYSIVDTGLRAGQRFGLRAVDVEKGRYWAFKR